MLMRIPAATAEPITPATLGPMACISRKLEGFSLWPTSLRNAGSHRHGGNACGTDQRVDLAAGERVHHLAAQDTCGGAEREGDQAQHDDEQGAGVEEGVGGGGAADRQCQEDGDNVHQLIAGGLLDTIDNAALLHQVAQHQHTDQNSGIRHDAGKR